MATDTTESPRASLSTLLETIQTSLSGAVASLPASDTPPDESEPEKPSIVPPSDGMSLLDTKSEILLSYLQNIVFLILLQVRQLSASAQQNSTANGAGNEVAQIQAEVTKKLVELRVYLDRGVRPLEGRLKYQIDKVLKAAEDSQRSQQQPQKHKANGTISKKSDAENGSEDEDESGSEESSSDSEEEEDQEVDELAYRPNLAAFSRATQEAAKQNSSATKDKGRAAGEDGIYRPPKIKPTAPPTSEPDRRDREARRTPKSRIMNEFVQNEMSGAPMAEASIGSTIRHGGRVVRTQRDREEDAERRTYEETNFTRLPAESKKEKRKKGKRPERSAGFGGEEWQGLGEGADRIERLTRRAKQGSGSNALERSRKRRATDDGPRGSGVNVGEGFEKRRKKIAGWKR